MATPPCCTSSSPTNTTVSQLYGVIEPIPFHLLSLIPSTSIPYSIISLCCSYQLRHGPYIPTANVCLLFGGYYGAHRPLGFPQGLSQERHVSLNSSTPSLGCLIVNAFGFCNSRHFTGQPQLGGPVDLT